MATNTHQINIGLTGEAWEKVMKELKLIFPMKSFNQIGKDIIAEYYMKNRDQIETLKNKPQVQKAEKPANLSLVIASVVNGTKRFLFSDGLESVLIEMPRGNYS